MKKSLTSIIGLAGMLVPLMASAIGIQVIVDGQTVVFSDVPQSAWFATYVQTAAETGIATGYRDSKGKLTGKFGPEKSVTVAEALKIASESAGYDETAFGAVVDSGVTHWASAYVSVGKSEGFPTVSGTVRLDNAATRAQVASMIASAFRADLKTTISGVPFKDVKTATTYGQAIEALQLKGVISGDLDVNNQPTGMFRPIEPINRAEVVKMAIEAKAKYGTPGKDRKPSTDVMSQLVVTYRDTGFSPSVLHVKKGDIVTFKNESNGQLLVASNPHPTHSDLLGFESQSILIGGEYKYTFTKTGTWGYHNHLKSSATASIVVAE